MTCPRSTLRRPLTGSRSSTRGSVRSSRPRRGCSPSRVTAERARYERHVVDMIEEAQRGGHVRADLPPSLLATLSLVLVNRAGAERIEHEPELVERSVASLLHRGLVPGAP